MPCKSSEGEVIACFGRHEPGLCEKKFRELSDIQNGVHFHWHSPSPVCHLLTTIHIMSSTTLEPQNKQRDADFNKAYHGSSANARGGLLSMIGKNVNAHAAAADDYWKHWDNKAAGDETDEIRKARRDEYATLTRHYYNLATDLYENGWGQSFHFCRFAYGEPFLQAIARHEHYLAHVMQLKDGQRVLDVGCGVGGPAREIAKFTGANIVGLNNNDYQIDRATAYAKKEGLAHQLSFVKGDFMVCTTSPSPA